MTKKTSAWIRLIAFSIVALILTGILLIGCFGDGLHFDSDFSFGFFTGSHYSNADAYTVGSGSVAADTLTDMEINWTSGEVTIVPSDGKEIEISENSSGKLKDKDKLRYLYQNGKLTVQYRKSAFFLFSSHPDKKLEVKIPRSLITQLSNVIIDSVSADVTLSELTTKTLDIETVSGVIKSTGITASQKADIETVSGDVNMDGSFGGIDSETVSGNCEYTSKTTPGNADFESVSGDILVTLPQDTSFKADYDTVSGDFVCDFESTNKDDSVIHGSGENHFDFETVSGDIRLSPLPTTK